MVSINSRKETFVNEERFIGFSFLLDSKIVDYLESDG
jgi:hypothetical protein